MATIPIVPVILSGGSGTRLWPLSREHRPKQVLALGGTEPLIAATARRTLGREGFTAPIIVAGAAHRAAIDEALGGDGGDARLILEPAGRNTAPAIALAAHETRRQGGDALLLVMPSDHRIADQQAFLRAVSAGRQAAEDEFLVTFGVTPSHPETGFGYIEAGDPIAAGVQRVAAFHEKPDAATAAQYVESGRFFWNAGIFLLRADTYLRALALHAPRIAEAAEAAFAGAASDGRVLRPDARAFARSPSQSVDYAVMEPAERRAVVPVDMGWSDIGSFAALYGELPKDADANALSGDTVVEDGRGNLLWSEGPLIAAAGIDDLVVVATGDVVLVVPRARSQDVKALLEAARRAAGDTGPRRH